MYTHSYFLPATPKTPVLLNPSPQFTITSICIWKQCQLSTKFQCCLSRKVWKHVTKSPTPFLLSPELREGIDSHTNALQRSCHWLLCLHFLYLAITVFRSSINNHKCFFNNFTYSMIINWCFCQTCSLLQCWYTVWKLTPNKLLVKNQRVKWISNYHIISDLFV